MTIKSSNVAVTGTIEKYIGSAYDTVKYVADNMPELLELGIDVGQFNDVYYGPLAVEPTLRNDGTAMQAGDMYFNTNTDVLYYFDGTIWTVNAAVPSTTEVSGLVELATQAEGLTNDAVRAVTPDVLNYVTSGANLQTKVDALTIDATTLEGLGKASFYLASNPSGYTNDLTPAEIKSSYEGNVNTNAFTDAEQTKLSGIETAATVDQTPPEILAALLTVDGAASGLDSQFLAGQPASYYTAATPTQIIDGTTRVYVTAPNGDIEGVVNGVVAFYVYSSDSSFAVLNELEVGKGIKLGATTKTTDGTLSFGGTRYTARADGENKHLALVENDNTMLLEGPVITKNYTVTTLPSVSLAGGMIFVSDEVGGSILAFSDGTNWRRTTDRAIVS